MNKIAFLGVVCTLQSAYAMQMSFSILTRVTRTILVATDVLCTLVNI